jgi:hypothetical protein
MDLSPIGAFNYQGLEAFCSIEELSRYQRDLFHPVQQSNAVPIDYTKMQNQGTEVIQFSYELKLRFLLKTFGLHEIAQTQSIDL